MRYLKGTKEYGLWYKKGGNLDLKAFIDANWTGNVDDKKSTGGEAFFLGKKTSVLDKKEIELYLSFHSKGRICGSSS